MGMVVVMPMGFIVMLLFEQSQELFPCQFRIVNDSSEHSATKFLSLMDGDYGGPPVWMPQKNMAAFLSYHLEARSLESLNHPVPG